MKVILIFFMLMLSLATNARKQLTFMGMPIKGVYSEFCEKLHSKGFVPCKPLKPFEHVTDEKDSLAWFERAEWAGESNVHFCVYYSKQTKVVHTILVWLVYNSVSEAINKKGFYYRKYREEYVNGTNDYQPDDYNVAIYNDKYDTIVDGMISIKQFRNYVGIMYKDCQSEAVDIYEDILTDYY